MKYKLRAFFTGRNGIDDLGKMLLWTSLIIMVLSLLLGITFLYSAALVLLCYVYIRAFSRNLENCASSSVRPIDFIAVPNANSNCVYPKERARSALHAGIAESILRRKHNER